jgi:putative membrane protein insertion efficiency factor
VSATPAAAPVRPSLGARALLGVIGAYQAVRRGRLSPCRFEPSCSVYAHEAIATHGAARGSALALRRLSRCRPLGGHGWDPVPAPPPRKAA